MSRLGHTFLPCRSGQRVSSAHRAQCYDFFYLATPDNESAIHLISMDADSFTLPYSEQRVGVAFRDKWRRLPYFTVLGTASWQCSPDSKEDGVPPWRIMVLLPLHLEFLSAREVGDS
ncbi:unnamed protein product [Cuscuta campestris]|uniref:Uncharacterized protein n=1 Tax=Cuscuta campestris TaxID=132261 RepID=A0A484LAW7_9ASTE|nr:unnamed protein product [Cuscuta campestris]